MKPELPELDAARWIKCSMKCRGKSLTPRAKAVEGSAEYRKAAGDVRAD
jgi:hypothetical protein